MRKLATIRKIDEIQSIPGADRIEYARIGGWWVVVKKGYTVGQRIIYFEIDSLLPNIPQFKFLWDKQHPKTVIIDGIEYTGIRLRTIKLKGKISQGLVLALDEFPELTSKEQDVSEALGIVKWEMPVAPVRTGGNRSNYARLFPTFIPKTDEERFQNCSELYDSWKQHTWAVTSKLDGSSFTAYIYNNHFGVCSRNFEVYGADLVHGCWVPSTITEAKRWRKFKTWMWLARNFWKRAFIDAPSDNIWIEAAKKKDLINTLPIGYAVQAELIGPSIQKNPLKLTERSLFVFYVYDIKRNEYLFWDAAASIAADAGLQMVPLVHSGWSLPTDGFTQALETMLKMADADSPVCAGSKQEGLVFRCEQNVHKVSFKVINNSYLLAEE